MYHNMGPLHKPPVCQTVSFLDLDWAVLATQGVLCLSHGQKIASTCIRHAHLHVW